MTSTNMTGSVFGNGQIALSSLSWNHQLTHHENIQACFLEAVTRGINRYKAFSLVASKLQKEGKTASKNALFKFWHVAQEEWKARQHSLCGIPSYNSPPAFNGPEMIKSAPEQGIVKFPQSEANVGLVVDGLNVIYGTPSHSKLSLMNLFGPLLELQNRKVTFKCFFDASTPFKLREAGRTDEADAYRKLCYDLPDTFIEVPGRTQADSFLLQYADHANAQFVSNDRFRDYEQKYPWLAQVSNRRAAFVVHSNRIQIPALNLIAPIPTDLAAADSTLRASFAN